MEKLNNGKLLQFSGNKTHISVQGLFNLKLFLNLIDWIIIKKKEKENRLLTVINTNGLLFETMCT